MNTTLVRRMAQVAALTALLGTGAARAHGLNWSIGIQAPLAPGVVMGTTVYSAQPVGVPYVPVYAPAPVIHAPMPGFHAPAHMVLVPAHAPVRVAHGPLVRRAAMPAPVYVGHRRPVHHRGHGHRDGHDRWDGRWDGRWAGRADGWRR